ncbi:MAG TPA: hypothetical protein PKD61_05955, partial [Polyangiaceae bacterium]|nr:hypothetical protein [Polyangiaceae bacterium]
MMRPSLELSLNIRDSIDGDSARCGTDVASAPTERITLPDGPHALNPADEEFFAVGDAGAYEGGPAVVELEPEIEDPATLPPPPPSPEQLKRRRRASRGVALAMGAFAAMSVVALLRVGIATASDGATGAPIANVPPVAVAAAQAAAQAAQAAQAKVAAPEITPAPALEAAGDAPDESMDQDSDPTALAAPTVQNEAAVGAGTTP